MDPTWPPASVSECSLLRQLACQSIRPNSRGHRPLLNPGLGLNCTNTGSGVKVTLNSLFLHFSTRLVAQVWASWWGSRRIGLSHCWVSDKHARSVASVQARRYEEYIYWQSFWCDEVTKSIRTSCLFVFTFKLYTRVDGISSESPADVTPKFDYLPPLFQVLLMSSCSRMNPRLLCT